ncbi:hypothetical protein ACT7DB_16565 [Bacillus cereus]
MKFNNYPIKIKLWEDAKQSFETILIMEWNNIDYPEKIFVVSPSPLGEGDTVLIIGWEDVQKFIRNTNIE